MGELLKDMESYLESKGVGTPAVNLFRGFLPDKPDEATAIYETGGIPPARAMAVGTGDEDGVVQKTPSIQVKSRGAAYDYDTPRAAVQAAYAALVGMAEQVIDGTRYTYVQARQEPFAAGRDKSGRVEVACNFDVMRDA